MQGKSRITVVDDDDGMRRALGQLLAAAGFEVTTFCSAEEFLRDKTPPSRAACLILDVHLPGLSGFDLWERVRLSAGAPPVIFITAHDDPATRARAAGLGAADYFPKPFAGRRLLEELNRITTEKR